MNYEIKKASADDYESAFALTRELIEYHNALDIFELTPQRMRELIEKNLINTYILYVDSRPAGIMNFFWKYTTFTGRKILYIEDLYMRSEFHGLGFGTKLIETSKKLASENDCEQIELKCASWNHSAAGFYKKIGMQSESEWITYTLNKSIF